MSIFSVNKAAKSRAQEAQAMSAMYQDAQSIENFGRELLSNIRQERMARSQLEFINQVEGVDMSSQAGAIANVDSGLASEEGYAYRYSQRLENIQYWNKVATENWEKYAKSVKRAKTNATIAVTAAGALAGGAAGLFGATAFGVAAATTIGSAAGATGVSLIGNNSVAGNAAWSTAVKQSAKSFASAGFSNSLKSFMTPVGDPSTGAALSGGVKIGETTRGLPVYDLTGTANSGMNVSFSNLTWNG